VNFDNAKDREFMTRASSIELTDLSILASPQAFDKLREDKQAFEKLSALGQMQLDPIQKCRYAQYLLYTNRFDEALALIEQVNPDEFLLAYSIKMKILEVIENYNLLTEMVEYFRPGSSEPLEAEATILGYESCAFYFSVVKKDFQKSYAYLYRAEALAIEHKLTYRFNVIRMHLEAVANMTGDNLTLDLLYEADTGAFKLKSIRNRFDSLLRAGNLQGIENLVEQAAISQEDFFLAQATLEYNQFILGEGNLSLVAEHITNHEPDYPESKFYWSLLMLQIFGYIGNGNGRANPERIYKTLESAINNIEQFKGFLPVAARMYPLGLSIASKLHSRLYNADKKVALLWSEHSRDGIRRNNKKLVTITKPIREALVLDEVYGTHEHYEAATHYQTGHAENKARLERSLKEVDLKRYEIATIGGVYRGLLRLGKTLDDKSILKQSQEVLESSVFLQNHVVLNALNF
jgi:exonuclease VII small subunit